MCVCVCFFFFFVFLVFSLLKGCGLFVYYGFLGLRGRWYSSRWALEDVFLPLASWVFCKERLSWLFNQGSLHFPHGG